MGFNSGFEGLTLLIAGMDTYKLGRILPTHTAGRHIAMNCLTLFIAGIDTYKLGRILPTHTAIQLTVEH